jgi:folate-dependent phosphoribosylglycinamide formyltransferase PurN
MLTNNMIMVQPFFKLLSTDLVENLAEKIHALEHLHYPVVIEKVILSQAD